MRNGGPLWVGRLSGLAVVATAAALFCLAWQPSLEGQVSPAGEAPSSRLSGTVLDRQSEGPVSGARLYVLDPSSGAQVAEAESDADGSFEFPPISDGTYGLRIERIGYRPVSDSVTVVAGDAGILEVYLVPQAIDMQPLVVQVPRTVAYYMRDFESRRTAGGGGTFITRSQIERRRARQTSEILQALGGVRVQYSTRGEAALFVRGACRPQVYVDGAAIHESVSIDMAVLPDDIEGMEVYSSATIPAHYATTGMCAAILVWTRPAVRGEARRKVSVWKVLLTGGVFLAVFLLGH